MVYKTLSEKEKKNVKSILIIGSIGIGNLILFSSSLRILREHFPHSKIIVIVLKSVFKYIYENDNNVDDIIVIPTERKVGIIERVNIIKAIRSKKPDLCITTFPANRLEYNLLAFLSGAKIRIAHKYDAKYVRAFSFLQNRKINVMVGIHDLEQNLNLLIPLGIDYTDKDKKLFMDISDEDIGFAEKYFKDNNIGNNDFIVGFHPGSSHERGMYLKRWDEEKYAELGDRLMKGYNAKIVIFGGNEEAKIKNTIKELMENTPLMVDNLSLGKVAGLLSRCHLFVSNDSGLMHIAVAFEIRSVAIFGPTDPSRTSPYGKEHIVVRKELPCSPCWSIHNLGVGNVNCIHPTNLCLKDLSVEEVFQVIKEIVKNNSSGTQH